MYRCRICANAQNNQVFTAREMMLGLRDRFEYFECDQCGCLQISDIPADLSKYYPSDYYSLRISKENPIKRILKRRRASQALGNNIFGGKWLLGIWAMPQIIECLKPMAIGLDDSILDVGSGAGQLLLELHNIGFRNLAGIDPYIEDDICYNNGVRISKIGLDEVEGTYDLVILDHSLEHMANQQSAMSNVARLVRLGKYALIRTPVAGTYAWRTYGVNWVQVDAPRHLFLHTKESMVILAKLAGFVVEKVIYESTAFQFWGSEQYQMDIPLWNDRSYNCNPGSSIFSPKDIKYFDARAGQLNTQHDGDQARFYLRRV